MSEDQEQEPARWQRATVDMVRSCDFAELFDSATTVHASEVGAAIVSRLQTEPEERADRPLLEMLSSILGMHETPTKVPPFGPVIVLANGSRSAAPDDFGGHLVEVIVAILAQVDHPVVRARLAHLAWFLERRRREEGLAALHAYIEIILRLDYGRLEARGERGILGVTGRDLLRMAFAVCHGLGRPAAEHDRLKAIAADLLRRADVADDGFGLRLFTDLALREAAMPPEDVAGIVETFIARTTPPVSTGYDDFPAQLWLLAARARKRAKDDDAAHAATRQAAECHVVQAEAFVGQPYGAMLAAHWMGIAITTLHDVPDVRERRRELRHRLIDMQASIHEDLVAISHGTDISDLVADIRKGFEGLPLHEALQRLTTVGGASPDPETLVDDARRSVALAPLSSLFEASHMDGEGKTVARSPGGGFGAEESTPEALEPTIVRAESIRRGVTARGGIEVARTVIMLEHHVSEEVLFGLLRQSPALPPHLVHTATRGFLHWFEGDMVSALYILTPLLEGILRHLLKQHGHDVTTMDDATRTQEDRTITSLYDALRPEMDAILGRGLTDDIWRTFLSKPGPGLRHGVAHALLSDGTPHGSDVTYGCWLIWMIVLWPLLPHWQELTGSLSETGHA